MNRYFRTGFLFILGIACFIALMNVAALFGQHIVDLYSYTGSLITVEIIVRSSYGAAFVTFIPIFSHIAIVGNKAPIKDYELTSESIFLNFGLFWFVVTFLVTLFNYDSLVKYYSLATSLLALWTFFGITNMITLLHKEKEQYKKDYDEVVCSEDETDN